MALIIVLLILVTTLLSGIFSLALLLRQKIRAKLTQNRRKSIGFFHPYPLAGGGGERVLWIAVVAASKRIPNADIIIYGHFGDNTNIAAIKGRIRDQFGISQLGDVSFIPVNITSSDVDFIRAAKYPRFTLILQAAGSVYLGIISYINRPCDVVIETGNFTFALFVPYLLGAKTVAYVHYPIVSADMLAFVRSGSSAFNNDALIARSKVLTSIKAVYYHGFAFLYAAAARCIHRPVANSSWTRRHLEAVWRLPNVRVVFPPCDISTIRDVEKNDKEENLVLSVGQFRPEKRHMLQLDAFERLEALSPGHKLRLVMVGGARGPSDAARAASLMKEAKDRKLPVQVRVNASHEDLDALLRKASIGLHTMRDEHFGISVVNMQANGLLTVAHKSGGVVADIISDTSSGFLVDNDTDDAFAQCILKAAKIQGTPQGDAIRRNSVKYARRFSNDSFQDAFGTVITDVWAQLPRPRR